MKTEKAVKLILPVILLTLMWAGGSVRGTMAATKEQLGYIPPAWSLKLKASKRFKLVLDSAAVLDKETGLVWEKSPDTTLRTWAMAAYYACNKNVGGRGGWRLPTVEELRSLIDTTQSNPALPSGHPFTNVQDVYYWSATTDASNTSNARVVEFYEGGVYNIEKSLDGQLWCVRGGHGQ